jgi:hypothetical protein
MLLRLGKSLSHAYKPLNSRQVLGRRVYRPMQDVPISRRFLAFAGVAGGARLCDRRLVA